MSLAHETDEVHERKSIKKVIKGNRRSSTRNFRVLSRVSRANPIVSAVCVPISRGKLRLAFRTRVALRDAGRRAQHLARTKLLLDFAHAQQACVCRWALCLCPFRR